MQHETCFVSHNLKTRFVSIFRINQTRTHTHRSTIPIQILFFLSIITHESSPARNSIQKSCRINERREVSQLTLSSASSLAANFIGIFSNFTRPPFVVPWRSVRALTVIKIITERGRARREGERRREYYYANAAFSKRDYFTKIRRSRNRRERCWRFEQIELGDPFELLETFRGLSTSRYLASSWKSRYRPTTAITLIRCMLLPTCSRLLSFFYLPFCEMRTQLARRGAISVSTLYRDYPLGVKICITEHYAIRPQLFTAAIRVSLVLFFDR